MFIIRELWHLVNNERGQLGGMISMLPGLIGLFGRQSRGARETSSMGRRAARAEATDIGGQRGIRDMLMQAALGIFGVSPQQHRIATLRQSIPLLSGGARRGQEQELNILESGGTLEEIEQKMRAAGFGVAGLGPQMPASLSPFRTELGASEREDIESQFQHAREDVIGGADMRGGVLSKGLQNVGIGRAQTVTRATGAARERGRSLALQLLTGQADPETAMGLPEVMKAEAMRESGRTGAYGQIGGALGKLLGMEGNVGMEGNEGGYRGQSSAELLLPSLRGRGLLSLFGG